MKRVLTAVVLIPIVLLIVFRGPGWLLGAVLGLVALLAQLEYLDIAESFAKPFRLTTLAFTIVLFAYTLVPDLYWYPGIPWPHPTLLVAIAPFIFLALGMSRQDLREGFLSAAVSYLALPYIALSLWSLIELAGSRRIFVFFVLVVVWIGDTCAYYVGRSMGKHLMAPRISPKKTWEGAVASVIGSVVAGVLVIQYAPEITDFLRRASLLADADLRSIQPHMVQAGVIAAIVNVAAQIGDLVESLIKRGADIKDSGRLLPGHGGILDRIDALLFAAPVATILFTITYKRFF
ncbi:MAG: phosphatidate cytidylyltransferase [Acidobacteriia bacterium]|nr:phosphatidate cytidylyltransferase [Terriglobia bacterium]